MQVKNWRLKISWKQNSEESVIKRMLREGNWVEPLKTIELFNIQSSSNNNKISTS